MIVDEYKDLVELLEQKSNWGLMAPNTCARAADALRRLSAELEKITDWYNTALDRGTELLTKTQNLEEELAALRAQLAQQEPCNVSMLSSRMCEQGTKGCETRHPAQLVQQEPVAWMVTFLRPTGEDTLLVYHREHAEQQVDPKLIISVEPLYLHPAPQADAKDAARIDWLDKVCSDGNGRHLCCLPGGLRAAIDAAMKGDSHA